MSRFNFKGLYSQTSHVANASSNTETKTDQQFDNKKSHVSLENDRNEFELNTIGRCGFPHQPTCVCCDSVQRLIAIGTRTGQIKIYGKEFVQYSLFDTTELTCASTQTADTNNQIIDQHKKELPAVWYLTFKTNEGMLISINNKSIVCLWDLKTSPDNLVRYRIFQKEKITSAYLTSSSKIILIGTQLGNVYMLNAVTLELSNQILYWNKCVGPTVQVHPGPVVTLTSCPSDQNKIIIVFSKCIDAFRHQSFLCRMNFRSKISEAVIRFPNVGITSISWFHDGKLFICSHTDGSISTWNIKNLEKPIKKEMIHASMSKNQANKQKPISKALWISGKDCDTKIIFSGGIYLENDAGLCTSRYLTVEKRKSVNVLQMESSIVDMCIFEPISEKTASAQQKALIILLETDMMIIDLQSDEFRYFDCPHMTDFGLNLITYFDYIADPERQLHQNLLQLSAKENARNSRRMQGKVMSGAPYPINGGSPGQVVFGYSELIMTGHVDGSVSFWDCSALNLSHIYTFNIAKFLAKARSDQSSGSSEQQSPSSAPPIADMYSSISSHSKLPSENPDVDNLLSVNLIKFSSDYKELLIAGYSHYIALFTMHKPNDAVSEELNDIERLTVYLKPINDQSSDQDNNEANFNCSSDDQSFKSQLKIKVAYRKQPGWQPQLVCLIKWLATEPDPIINQVAVDSIQKIIVASINNYLIVIDCVFKNVVMNINVCELYHLSDSQSTPSPQKNVYSQSALSLDFGGGGTAGGGGLENSTTASNIMVVTLTQQQQQQTQDNTNQSSNDSTNYQTKPKMNECKTCTIKIEGDIASGKKITEHEIGLTIQDATSTTNTTDSILSKSKSMIDLPSLSSFSNATNVISEAVENSPLKTMVFDHIKESEPSAEINKNESSADINRNEPSAEINKNEPSVEVNKNEPPVDIKKNELTTNTEKSERSSHIKKSSKKMEPKITSGGEHSSLPSDVGFFKTLGRSLKKKSTLLQKVTGSNTTTATATNKNNNNCNNNRNNSGTIGGAFKDPNGTISAGLVSLQRSSYDRVVELAFVCRHANGDNNVQQVEDASHHVRSIGGDQETNSENVHCCSDSKSSSLISAKISSALDNSRYSLLVGCASGSVIVLNIAIVVDQTRAITLTPTGFVVSMSDQIILIEKIDQNVGGAAATDSQHHASESSFILIVCKREARLLSWSSDYCTHSQRTFSESRVAKKAWIGGDSSSVMRKKYLYTLECCENGCSVVVCTNSTATATNICIYSLPELEQIKVFQNIYEHIPVQLRIGAESSMRLDNHGRLAFLASPTEVEKLTVIKNECVQMSSIRCSLFDGLPSSSSLNHRHQRDQKSNRGSSSSSSSQQEKNKSNNEHFSSKRDNQMNTLDNKSSSSSFSQTILKLFASAGETISEDVFDERQMSQCFGREPHGIVGPIMLRRQETFSDCSRQSQRANVGAVHNVKSSLSSKSAENNKACSAIIATTGKLNKTKSSAIQAGENMSQLLRAGAERGEKLDQLESTAAMMAENAHEFKSVTRQLAEREKQKAERWWQVWKH